MICLYLDIYVQVLYGDTFPTPALTFPHPLGEFCIAEQRILLFGILQDSKLKLCY